MKKRRLVPGLAEKGELAFAAFAAAFFLPAPPARADCRPVPSANPMACELQDPGCRPSPSRSRQMNPDTFSGPARSPTASLSQLQGWSLIFGLGTGLQELAQATRVFGFRAALPFGRALRDPRPELAAGPPVGEGKMILSGWAQHLQARMQAMRLAGTEQRLSITEPIPPPVWGASWRDD